MATYLMFGNYTSDSLGETSKDRTAQAIEAITAFGGELKEMYAMLGSSDLLLIVELPGTEQAMQASLALNRLTGISFNTRPAIQVDNFDNLIDSL